MKFRIIVNGQPADVTAKSKHALHSVIPSALDQTGNSGQPPENWELRDVTGTLLDTTKAISEFGFGEGARLYLNLKAGIGGSEQACAGHVCLDAGDGTGHQVITLGCARADAHRMHYDEDRGLWWADVDELVTPIRDLVEEMSEAISDGSPCVFSSTVEEWIDKLNTVCP